ncbi:MAG: hypothetical protein LZF60_390002 [Nitrospira sp.]|nr:MAG: hypothetical protein LZF60_390002 [Nitrospira sp.]
MHESLMHLFVQPHYAHMDAILLVYPLSVCRIGNIRPSQFEIFERTFARGIEVLQFTCRNGGKLALFVRRSVVS